MKTSFLFLADGFEEIEALATVDVLRRAGITVQTVSIYTHKHVKGAHGVEGMPTSLLRKPISATAIG